MLAAAAEEPDVHVRSFECLGACDIAPMASVDGEYVGPLDDEDAGRIIEDLRKGGPVLEHKQLRYRRCADPGAQRPRSMKLLFDGIDEPGLNTLAVYEQRGGYEMLKTALSMAPDEVLANISDSGLRGPRRRRLPDGPEGRRSCHTATWTSTSSATPTSPSRARSRTAS